MAEPIQTRVAPRPAMATIIAASDPTPGPEVRARRRPGRPEHPEEAPPWTERAAIVFLAIWVASGPLAGLLWMLWLPAALFFLGLAVTSLVAALLLGSA